MKYTTLGRTGLRVSRLGFGCMRLPMRDATTVDRDLAIPLLQDAVRRGVTYFDTAVGYCGADSQRVLGEALAFCRDKVVLSTKNPMHDATPGDWWARLEESLRLLRTDRIDVYNLHGVNWGMWASHLDGPQGKLRLLARAREQGLIRHACCSVHDSPEGVVRLAESGAFASITLQYNLLDQSLGEAMHRLRELGVGVVVMGPVGGGRLGVRSERIRELTGNRVRSTPEAALRFVLAHPAVSLALSGMGDLAMLEENDRIVSGTEPFSAAEVAAIDAEARRVRERLGVLCPSCGYCQPCPAGVKIPQNFAAYNDQRIYGLDETARKAYADLGEGRAGACTACGACLAKCPQKIDIPARLREVAGALGA